MDSDNQQRLIQVIQRSDGDDRIIEIYRDVELLHVHCDGPHFHSWCFPMDLIEDGLVSIGRAAMVDEIPYDWEDAAIVSKAVRQFAIEYNYQKLADKLGSPPKDPQPTADYSDCWIVDKSKNEKPEGWVTPILEILLGRGKIDGR